MIIQSNKEHHYKNKPVFNARVEIEPSALNLVKKYGLNEILEKRKDEIKNIKLDRYPIKLIINKPDWSDNLMINASFDRKKHSPFAILELTSKKVEGENVISEEHFLSGLRNVAENIGKTEQYLNERLSKIIKKINKNEGTIIGEINKSGTKFFSSLGKAFLDNLNQRTLEIKSIKANNKPIEFRIGKSPNNSILIASRIIDDNSDVFGLSEMTIKKTNKIGADVDELIECMKQSVQNISKNK